MARKPRSTWILMTGFGAAAAIFLLYTPASGADSPRDSAPERRPDPPKHPDSAPRHKPGQRFTIGEPARSNGPDLNQERWSIQPSQDSDEASKSGEDRRRHAPALWNTRPPHPPEHYLYWYWAETSFLGLGVGYNDAIYYYPPIAGIFSQIDPNLIIYPPSDLDDVPPTPPTPAELLFEGAYVEAAEALRAELESSPDDLERRRLLALALSGDRQFTEAADLILDVHASDPDIAVYPLDGDALFQSPLDLRRIVVGAVRHAQRTGTARSWLLVAVLMQAEGREGVAFDMIERAKEQGLDAAIVEAWPDPAA